ncbi:glycine-rich domain-containing protein [Chitinolyticbacter albus]|uniref:glycine-rich domain-containing protein n=1 Tax=Chitinolyticbacter albus TaxID=2961951 RepID=UPI00210C0685|nr:hypothetical protein [Chitinolyticbacter albus]
MFTLLLIALLLVAAYLGWRWHRRRRQRQRIDAINGYVFPAAIRTKLQQQHGAATLDGKALLKVEAALRQFFRINGAAGPQRVAMPSQLVDDYWHQFILHTREYQRFCKATLGRFLHHTPASSMAGARQQDYAIRRTWVLACQDEGLNPHAPNRLPLLFSIDALLGIAGGYHYTMHCGERGDGSATTPYCGSDLVDNWRSDTEGIGSDPSHSGSDNDHRDYSYNSYNDMDSRSSCAGDSSDTSNDTGSGCGSGCGGGGSD